MSNILFAGPLPDRLRSFAKLNQIALQTYIAHMKRRKMAPDWDIETEIGIRFWRHQFTVALGCKDFARGRVLFDSVQTETDDIYDVSTRDCPNPRGTWYDPGQSDDSVLLYFHGGGYGLHSAISKRFAAMLAHRMGRRLFAPDYRLTPEHPHPAQSEDALAAWAYLSQTHDPKNIVVIGDSAGGHMALMLLQSLRHLGEAQPALCVGLCPWTDIGRRGDSLSSNDRYDLVQGWMALEFGRWLDPEGKFGRKALSPFYHDFNGLAPIYLQAGGREVLRDMIVEFAETQNWNGAQVRLDLWPDMPHVFQAYDSWKLASTQALDHLRNTIDQSLKGQFPPDPGPFTQI